MHSGLSRAAGEANFDCRNDNIMPVALGGATMVESLQPLRADCNRPQERHIRDGLARGLCCGYRLASIRTIKERDVIYSGGLLGAARRGGSTRRMLRCESATPSPPGPPFRSFIVAVFAGWQAHPRTGRESGR
jgi:hypothetical protein